ncbi:ketopantoate reductase family protein [Alteribacillus sp. HJP-4]|uniref:ketopantoate reductase family protein n=1 Tax=Alteribacillus sp. HJP-4 TaxID=2775394 RepID=UPI0035CD2743
MNIIIQGAGALGIYFGGRLMESNHNVSYLVRSKRAQQLIENGLKIQSTKGNFESSEVNVLKSPGAAGYADLILLAIKGQHLEGALPALKTLVQQTGAPVLPLLNGMEHIEVLQAELGPEKVLGGLAYIIATLDERGHVIHTSEQHDLYFGKLSENQNSICKKMEDAFEGVNVNAKLHQNIHKQMWSKYMFISAFSGITTAAGLPIGEIVKHKSTYRTAIKLLQEMKELAVKEGASITDEAVEKAAAQFRDLPVEGTSSMHQDLRKGQYLEVEHLHGGALRAAKKNHLSMPVTETIYGLIKPWENKGS